MTNALAQATSPYLLQHAENPVDWMPWGEAAFDKARAEDKPILVSVGYSTCYWCHVMERQCFEDDTIAALMNEHFVCIKVDREERPDVDDIYMAATQIMTGSGGWPMNVFLTPPRARGSDDPGLKPFFAGTYYPPQPMHGRPSWPQVLDGIAQAWREQRREVVDQADRLASAVTDHVAQAAAPGALDDALPQRAAQQLMGMYDARHGGFGRAPKFPTPANLAFLLAHVRATGDERVAQALHHTLDRMARGGVYDQVGGGFHRYSVDERWLVPHFEKMLYDNGQLIELYTAAAEHAQAVGDTARHDAYRRVAIETADYLLREMRDSHATRGGGFHSAQDAEVNAMEGGNYVWTREQVEQALADRPDLRTLAIKMYGLDQGTNFTDPHHPDATPVNVLFLATPLDDLADGFAGGDRRRLLDIRREINATLLAIRDQRDQPGTDDKVLTAWNGMAIAGLARAGRLFDASHLIDAAAAAADAIAQHLTDADGHLLRSMRRGEVNPQPGFLEDHATYAHGLIALRHATNEARWLDRAIDTTQRAIDRFAAKPGGYFDTLADRADLFVRTRGVYDGAIPSGNAQMAHNLIALHEATGEAAYRDRAVDDLRSHAAALRRLGGNMAHMQHALLRALTSDTNANNHDVAHRLALPGPADDAIAATPDAADDTRTDAVEPVTLSAQQTADATILTLTIAPGHHLNAAGGAAGEELVPLAVAAADPHTGHALEVTYPDPTTRELPYGDGPLPVYEGEAHVHIAGHPDRITLHYQACTDTACLQPKALELSLTQD